MSKESERSRNKGEWAVLGTERLFTKSCRSCKSVPIVRSKKRMDRLDCQFKKGVAA